MGDRIEELIDRIETADSDSNAYHGVTIREIERIIRQWAGEQPVPDGIVYAPTASGGSIPTPQPVAGEKSVGWWCCKADYGEHEPTCPNYKPVAGELRERVAVELRDSYDAGELTAWADLLLVSDRILALLGSAPRDESKEG